MPLKKNILFASLFLIPFCFASAQVKERIKQLDTPNSKMVLVTAHRGDWRNAPENSLQAYKLAIEMGVDGIEVDLNKTKDGVLVIMHDGSINRTTDSQGKPSDYTLAELKKFHLRNGLGIVTKHQIPTLEEVMLLAKGKVLVNLDKSYSYYREAYAVLKKTGTLEQAIFKTDIPYSEVRSKYGTLLDSLTFMPVVDLDKPSANAIIDEYQQKMRPVAFELIFRSDTAAVLKNLKSFNARGARVWINSLWPSLNGGHADDMAVEENNTKDSWDWLLNRGATMLQTDRPVQLFQYLKKRSLHR